MKLLLSILLLWGSWSARAATKEIQFREGSLLNIAPPIINKDYYMIEYGFMVKKEIAKWKYNYNAFVNAALFEDWQNRQDRLRAGALGFKGGVLFPLGSYPLYYRVAVGFAKTALHKNPIFGKEEQSVAKKTMFLFEPGLTFKFDHTYLTLTYQASNVKYFKRHLILSFGVNY